MAEEIVALANACIDQLIATLEPVEQALPPQEFANYKRAIAKVINSFDLELIDLVAKGYPDLKPADDDAELADSAEANIPKGSRN